MVVTGLNGIRKAAVRPRRFAPAMLSQKSSVRRVRRSLRIMGTADSAAFWRSRFIRRISSTDGAAGLDAVLTRSMGRALNVSFLGVGSGSVMNESYRKLR